MIRFARELATLDSCGLSRYDCHMKFTQYFHHVHERPDRKEIKLEWIARVCSSPEHEFVQPDRRIRRWAAISEAGGKHLRVVLLEDGETVHNAFFDRSFREVKNED